MAYYVPGTSEKDLSKVITSLQQAHSVAATNTTNTATNTANIATNTTAIAALNAVTYVNSLNAKTGAISLRVVKQIFTASGTYTPTTGMVYCVIECVGGGGSSGGLTGTAATFLTSGGGGGGEYSVKTATSSDVGASKSVTIGAGGSAPSAGNAGSAGGDTSVGTLCIAKGGSGGQATTSINGIGGGAAGGTGGTGDFKIPGGYGGGGSGFATSGNQAFYTAFGGASHMSGSAVTSTGASVGAAGVAYGGGASGSTSVDATSRAGAAGAAGIVIITEYVIA